MLFTFKPRNICFMSTVNTTSYQPTTTFDPITIGSFKAYDIRGELGVALDEDIDYLERVDDRYPGPCPDFGTRGV